MGNGREPHAGGDGFQDTLLDSNGDMRVRKSEAGEGHLGMG